jgi:hypothetical protein
MTQAAAGGNFPFLDELNAGRIGKPRAVASASLHPTQDPARL